MPNRRWYCRFVFASLLLGVPVVSTGCGNGDGGGVPVLPAVRGEGVARPIVEGPVSGGAGVPFLATTTFDLAEVDYSQEEYFLSGTAHSYTNLEPLRVDGRWSVTPAASADYKTRIVVYRPRDRSDFNGTVIVEWLNVSGGVDAAADWLMAHTELIREGYAWVGVSAQIIGVEGGTPLVPGLTLMPLKTTDPERYGTLSHPGDSFSYDIFSQAAQAVRRPTGPSPLGDLYVQRVIAAGESQSAFRMVTYVNAIQPIADIFDGFLIHSRGSLLSGALSEAPQAAISVPGTAIIRTDTNVPVLTFETETDLGFLGFVPARQPDTDRIRLWEVAGTAHADTYTTIVGNLDRGDSPSAADLIVTAAPLAGFPECSAPINSGPQHFVLKAAIAALHRWVRTGELPPIAPRLELIGLQIARDEHGNALGGIRTPYVDVPIATLRGDGQSGSIFCLLFGTTVPFDGEKLASLYSSHEAYVEAVEASTDAAVEAGFLLPPDARLIVKSAEASNIGN